MGAVPNTARGRRHIWNGELRRLKQHQKRAATKAGTLQKHENGI